MSDLAPISSTMHTGYSARTQSPSSFLDAKPSATKIEGSSDRVELSEHARFLQMLRDMPEVRQDRVERARKAIAQGAYDAPEKLEIALERMFEDMN